MPIALRLLSAALPALLLAGCVQRTITLTSQPDGALVYLNDEEVGRTPVTVPFTFYGVYDVRLVRDGSQTLNTTRQAKAPWYDQPGVDFVSEVLPVDANVDLTWHFELADEPDVDEAAVIDRAREMRTMLDSAATPPQVEATGEPPTEQPDAAPAAE